MTKVSPGIHAEKITCGRRRGYNHFYIKVRRNGKTREYQAAHASYLRWCKMCNRDAMVKKSTTFNVISDFFYDEL